MRWRLTRRWDFGRPDSNSIHSNQAALRWRHAHRSLIGLYLGENQIIDVSPLSTLTSLATLWLNGNQITDVSPVFTLTSLRKLGLTRKPDHRQDPAGALHGSYPLVILQYIFSLLFYSFSKSKSKKEEEGFGVPGAGGVRGLSRKSENEKLVD